MRTTLLGSFPTGTVQQLAGYNSGAHLSKDVRTYSLPIRSHAPDSWRECRYRIAPTVRAAILGRLRNLGVPASKAGPLLEDVDDGAVEDAVARLWANVSTRVWVALPRAYDAIEHRVFCESEAEVIEAIGCGAEVVFEMTDTLNQLLRRA